MVVSGIIHCVNGCKWGFVSTYKLVKGHNCIPYILINDHSCMFLDRSSLFFSFDVQNPANLSYLPQFLGIVRRALAVTAIESGPVEIVDFPLNMVIWWIFPVRYVQSPDSSHLVFHRSIICSHSLWQNLVSLSKLGG